MSKTMAKADGSSEQTLIGALAERPDATVAELAAHAGLGRSTVSGLLTKLEQCGKVVRAIGGRDGSRRMPDRWSHATTETQARNVARLPQACGREQELKQHERAAQGATRDRDRRSSEDRLPAGALDGLVLDYMRVHGDSPVGPGMIAKAIDKSAGAVANCLVRLARDEHVRQVSEQPIRYSLAAYPRSGVEPSLCA